VLARISNPPTNWRSQRGRSGSLGTWGEAQVGCGAVVRAERATGILKRRLPNFLGKARFEKPPGPQSGGGDRQGFHGGAILAEQI